MSQHFPTFFETFDFSLVSSERVISPSYVNWGHHLYYWYLMPHDCIMNKDYLACCKLVHRAYRSIVLIINTILSMTLVVSMGNAVMKMGQKIFGQRDNF